MHIFAKCVLFIMTVYVDECRLEWKGKNWCHLVADSIQELHCFADKLGLKREWFQDRTLYPHYDITMSVKRKALALGAQEGDKGTVIGCSKRLWRELLDTKRALLQEASSLKTQNEDNNGDEKAGRTYDPSQLLRTGSKDQQVLFT